MKKGIKPQVIIQPERIMPKEERKIGPAESKLKSMMKKDSPISIDLRSPVGHKNKVRKESDDDIGEEINEEFDEYGNESFEKLSVGYESAIKESIAGESNVIKESIRESIRESLGGSTGQIKESIR
jgi:hypothetical protein